MFSPSLFPDEIHNGYFGRIIRFNGWPKGKLKAMDLLRLSTLDGYFTHERPQVTELLAFVAAIPVQDFVMKHTLLPYRRAIASHKQELVHGDPDDVSMIRLSSTRAARGDAFFCARCVGDDLRNYGFSYWRRSHQLPGMYVCLNHDEVLQYVDVDDAFFEAPSKFISRSHMIDETWAIQSNSHPRVFEFLKLSLALASGIKPFDLRVLRPILAQQARIHGLATFKGAEKDLLSDRINSHYPSKWLSAVFPSISEKCAGKPMDQLDGTLYLSKSSSSIVVYLLAICVLFDSAETALAALSAVADPVIAQERRKATRTRSLDAGTLQAEYIRLRGSHSEIARSNRVILNTTNSQLLALGLPNLTQRGNSNGSLIDAAENFFVHNMSLEESAIRANVSFVALERVVRNAGMRLSGSLKEMNSASFSARAAVALGKNQSLHLIGLAAPNHDGDKSNLAEKLPS